MGRHSHPLMKPTCTYSKMSSSSLMNMICFWLLPKGQYLSRPGITSRVSTWSAERERERRGKE